MNMHDVKTQNAGQIIKGRSVVEDSWLVLRAAELPEGVKAEAEDIAALPVPAGKVIVPVAVWNAQREELLARAAIGDVLRDQLFSMQRVGFDAYAVRADRDIHDALKGLSDFSETYQASVDQKVPLFRRHTRNVGVNTGDAGFG